MSNEFQNMMAIFVLYVLQHVKLWDLGSKRAMPAFPSRAGTHMAKAYGRSICDQEE